MLEGYLLNNVILHVQEEEYYIIAFYNINGIKFSRR